MILPKASTNYDAGQEQQARGVIERADAANVKKGGPYDLQSPNGTWWRPSIDDAGALTWTAL